MKYKDQIKPLLEAFLKGKAEPILLYTLSIECDKMARSLGKKKDLFPSLFDYENIIPPTWTTAMLKVDNSEMSDSLLYAIPKKWKSSDSDSNSLLLGQGKLVFARNT